MCIVYRLFTWLLCLDSLLPSLFFFNDTATTEFYSLSLHDALPISCRASRWQQRRRQRQTSRPTPYPRTRRWRSEEHTSELQSHSDLVCRLLLEKKKNGSLSTPAQS